MSQANLEQFQQLVLRQPALQERLNAASDRETFLQFALQLGAEHGCSLTAMDLEAALRGDRPARLYDWKADPPALAGWVPIRLRREAGRPLVEWCYLGDSGFTRPFFEQTISARLRHPFNRLFCHLTPIDTLAELHAHQPGLPPSGFVFHMSRCGSTLIAQMLAALPQALVISEAEPIDAVLRARFHYPYLTDDQRIDWLRWMVSALGQPRAATHQHYVIKFDCWNILDFALIRRAFPTVPWIFVYRDPLEVLVSHHKQPGSQIVPGMLEPALLDLDAVAISRIPPLEYGARVLARICRAAIAQYQPGEGLLINYQQLPEVAWPALLDFFGIPCCAEDDVRMRHVAQFHAKNPAFYFEDDTAAKHDAATQPIQHLADQWLAPLYNQLEALRQA